MNVERRDIKDTNAPNESKETIKAEIIIIIIIITMETTAMEDNQDSMANAGDLE